MYKIEQTGYGIRMVFQGFMKKEELKSCFREMAQMMQKIEKGFGLIHDMRGMSTLPKDAADYMMRNMKVARKAGIGRSAQIVSDVIAGMQFKRLAKEAGIDDLTRQIDASTVPDCEKVAFDWVLKGSDPDN